MKMLNLGCGKRFHTDWVNVDFVSSGKGVIAHNLLQGIPFGENEFDVVYHSHVLEHFSKDDAKKFIAECYRVLKKGGILRIAVPDLERIARAYLEQMESALNGNMDAQNNYEWMMIEMYDQTVRNESGGEMAKYLSQVNIPNEKFVYSRIGEEGKVIRERSLEQGINKHTYNYAVVPYWKKIFNPAWYINVIQRIFSHQQFKKKEADKKALDIGKFRVGGEIHQWMYDRYSLAKLLENSGLGNIKVKSATDSNIANWNSYVLESKNGIVFKPDSLFMEAVK